MQFGVAIPTYRMPDGVEFMTEAAQAAEALGYHSIWFADHLAIPDDYLDHLGPEWYEPVVTAAYLAAQTQRVKIGWDVLIVPYRNPLVLAKMVATLDAMCEGRVIFAGAAGYVEGEFAGLGLDFRRRGEMTDEYLRIMRELWTNEDPAFEGKYFQFSEIKASPKPYQKPHPPVWIGGNSMAAIRRAALLGDGWHPLYPSAEEVARGVAEIEALRGDQGLDGFTVSYSCSHVLQDAALDIDALPETMRETRFRGTPEQIASEFNRLSEAGVRHATVRFVHHLGGPDQFVRQLERFMADIAPLVE
ncbi:MAG: LLM class F420-dependent oxidoreductase [Dehalococcoidia bacterium]